MSATKRGAKRHEADYYATPESAFKPLLQYIAEIDEPVFEPACGDERLMYWLDEGDICAEGNDLVRGYNFLQDDTHYPCIVTNPPFSLALEFCHHAIMHAEHVFMLLRLNFLASQKRRGWWLKHKPDALFILSERPSFTDNGKTDATDYAWFYWGTVHKGFYFL